MSGYNSDLWLAVCATLTALGLVLTVLIGRRRSVRAMLHGIAWSLIPIAAYLTGSTQMLWRIGVAIGDWARAFVFSTERWAGIGVVALIVLLFLAAGGRQRRRQARAKRHEGRQRKIQASEAAVGAGSTAAIGASKTESARLAAGAQPWTRSAPEPEPARKAAPSKGSREQQAPPAGKGAGAAPSGLGDMAEIEEILRKRGIT
jgi:hypothetical protein